MIANGGNLSLFIFPICNLGPVLLLNAKNTFIEFLNLIFNQSNGNSAKKKKKESNGRSKIVKYDI